MFSGLPSFFNFPKSNNEADTPSAGLFAGVPLINPLLNDADTNLKSLEERIAQLESVSQWLNMNLQMVNTSVQQLQVQKQTLQALAEWQKLSKDAMAQFAQKNTEPANQGDAEPQKTATPKKTKAKPEAMPSQPEATAAHSEAFEQAAQSWWNGLQQQFIQLAQPLVEAAKPAVEPKKPASRSRKKASPPQAT